MTALSKTLGDERRDGEEMTAFTIRRIRNEIIQECLRAAMDVPMPRYGTNARFTGRAEMQGWIVKAIGALKQ